MVKETGSGLNGNRRRLCRIIGNHTVSTIIVEHRDRLCRFGFEYVEAALAGRGARIVVMEDGETGDNLVRDVTEVMTSPRARLSGSVRPGAGRNGHWPPRGRVDASHLPNAHFGLRRD